MSALADAGGSDASSMRQPMQQLSAQWLLWSEAGALSPVTTAWHMMEFGAVALSAAARAAPRVATMLANAIAWVAVNAMTRHHNGRPEEPWRTALKTSFGNRHSLISHQSKLVRSHFRTFVLAQQARGRRRI